MKEKAGKDEGRGEGNKDIEEDNNSDKGNDNDKGNNNDDE